MRRTAAFCLALALTRATPLLRRQAVTEAISPSAPAPPGCTGSYSGIFGIAISNVSSSDSAQKRQADQPLAGSSSDMIDPSADQTSPSDAPAVTVAQVTQIGDGQIQGGMQTVTMPPVTQIQDGQIQNGVQPAAPAPNAPTATLAPSDHDAGDNSIPAPATATTFAHSNSTSTTATGIDNNHTSISPSSPASNSSHTTLSTNLVACLTNSTLTLTLADGILRDGHNRTGYIASNYQFQFDGPPQSGSLYTAGWSVCGNGTLALGGNAIFWQCLSGEFYNLYDRWWAEQCSPVFINVVGLVSC